MKPLSLSLFSLFLLLPGTVFGASCCVSNTSVSNLMIMPSKWQETVTLSQSRVIGDVDDKGQSTFRRSSNRDVTNLVRLDLAYGWTFRYQTGVSVKYQGRTRQFNGDDSSSSGWSDVGLSQAYKLSPLGRLWAFSTVNIPTARSIYNANDNFSVDARGSGTYQAGAGIFGIHNTKVWDFIYSGEVHHSFGRTFRKGESETRVGSFWGTSITGGVGYIPFRSKFRYGANLTPHYEGAKTVTSNGTKTNGKGSVLWDTSLNLSYTLNAYHAFGLSYIDQTLLGPARNTLLSRTVSFQWQTKWE